MQTSTQAALYDRRYAVKPPLTAASLASLSSRLHALAQLKHLLLARGPADDRDEAHAERLRRLEASAGATLLRLQALEEALLEEREAREAERQAAEAVRPRRGSGWLGFAARGA